MVSLTESWGPIWLPRSRCDRTPCPVYLLDLTPGQEAIRCSPRANTTATMTWSQAYRHRIASSCSRETEKKEKFPGSEARNLASAVEASGKELGEDLAGPFHFRRVGAFEPSPAGSGGNPACGVGPKAG